MANYTGLIQGGAMLALEQIYVKVDRGIKNIYYDTAAGKRVFPVDITAQAVVEEIHHDDMEITDHPVEMGASISDHMFKRPAEVVLHLGWSNSPTASATQGLIGAGIGALSSISPVVRQIADLVGTAQAAIQLFNDAENGGGKSVTVDMYEQLLALQTNRCLFEIYTGKRKYEDMVCRSLSVHTDSKSENALYITMTCRQVIMVETELYELPPSKQADASNTASTAAKGQKTAAQTSKGPQQ